MYKKLNSRYSFLDLFRLAFSWTTTKIFFRPCRLIRQPTRIRGFNYMNIGKNFTTGSYCRLEASSNNSNTSLVIGDNVEINDGCHIASMNSIVIADNVLIASNVFISDHDHGSVDMESLSIPPKLRKVNTAPILIERNVWIGEKATILKGVSIGEGSIVAAGAVVTNSFPAYSIIGGVPARIIKKP